MKCSTRLSITTVRRTSGCQRWSAGSGPASSAFFKSLLRVTHKMFMLTTIHHMSCHLFGNTTVHKFYFRVNISSFITQNNSSRFFWYNQNLSMSGRPARRPWSRFWEAYISGTVSPIDKRSSLVGSPIPSAVHGTNAESWQCTLWHVARATWEDVTNVPPAVSR